MIALIFPFVVMRSIFRMNRPILSTRVGFWIMRKRYGLLTEVQVEVMKLRLKGLTQKEIASKLGTTHQNIAIIEKRGKRNMQLAEETIRTYEEITSATSVEVGPGIHMVDIPRLVVDAADKANIKLKADFTRVYNEIKFKASGCIEGTKVVKPITLVISNDGDIEIAPRKHQST